MKITFPDIRNCFSRIPRYTIYDIRYTTPLSIFLGISLLLTLQPSHIQATSQLTLAPAIIRTTVTDPNLQIEAVYHLKNTTPETIQVVALPQTIDRYDPIGRPILGDMDLEAADIASQIEINPSSATLFPGEEITFTATIHPTFLKPGSNYAIIVFKQQTEATDATHNIIPVISGLLQIRNPEGEDRRLHLNTLNLPSFTTQLPEDISVEFQNPGNSDVTPYGDVLASSTIGQAVDIGYLNHESRIIYPGQTQSIAATLDQNIPAKPIDLITFSIAGHDEADSIHFNHHQQLIYISPTLIFLFTLLIVVIMIFLLNKKFKFLELKKDK